MADPILNLLARGPSALVDAVLGPEPPPELPMPQAPMVPVQPPIQSERENAVRGTQRNGHFASMLSSLAYALSRGFGAAAEARPGASRLAGFGAAMGAPFELRDRQQRQEFAAEDRALRRQQAADQSAFRRRQSDALEFRNDLMAREAAQRFALQRSPEMATFPDTGPREPVMEGLSPVGTQLEPREIPALPVPLPPVRFGDAEILSPDVEPRTFADVLRNIRGKKVAETVPVEIPGGVLPGRPNPIAVNPRIAGRLIGSAGADKRAAQRIGSAETIANIRARAQEAAARERRRGAETVARIRAQAARARGSGPGDGKPVPIEERILKAQIDAAHKSWALQKEESSAAVASRDPVAIRRTKENVQRTGERLRSLQDRLFALRGR